MKRDDAGFLVLKTAADFLDDLQLRFGVTSDYALQPFTGWKRQQTTRYRTGRTTFDDTTSAKVARWLNLNPAYVSTCMAWQRAKTPEQKSMWETVVKNLATSAGALAIAIGLGALAREFDISGFTAALGILAFPTSTVYTLCAIAALALAYAAATRAAIAGRYPSIPQTLLARFTRPIWGAL